MRTGPVVVLADPSRVAAAEVAGLTPLADRLHVNWGSSDNPQVGQDGVLLGLDGAVVINGRLVASATELQALRGDLSPEALVDRWGAGATQSGCAYVWDPRSRRMTVLPDPLGGATVFVHESADLTVLGTDYGALVDVLAALGAAPTADPMYQVERSVFGAGGLWHTSHVGGRRVPSFHHLVVTSDEVRELTYASRPDPNSPEGYLNNLVAVREDLLRGVEAVAAASAQHRIAHLTGGFDSRLVLGGILACGLADRFDFFCSGSPESTDREIADGLARTFGLRRIHTSGLAPDRVANPAEQQLRLLRYTAGLSTVGPTGSERLVDVIAAGGGYGELLRSFYGDAISGQGMEPWTAGAALVEGILGGQAEDPLLTPSAREALGQRLSETLSAIEATGVPRDAVGDTYYSEVRNRYHMGATSLAWSRVGVRVNPLYSVHALNASRAVSALARRANVPGYDLLESLPGELSRYPFDHDRSSPEYRRQRRARAPLAFADGSLRWGVEPPLTADAPPPIAVPEEQRRVRLDRASALGVHQWQSVHLEETQEALAGAVEMLGASTLTDLVRVDYLKELATTAQWTRPRVRHVYGATSMLLWLAEQESGRTR